MLVKVTEEGSGAVSLALEGRGTLYREDLVVMMNFSSAIIREGFVDCHKKNHYLIMIIRNL